MIRGNFNDLTFGDDKLKTNLAILRRETALPLDRGGKEKYNILHIISEEGIICKINVVVLR